MPLYAKYPNICSKRFDREYHPVASDLNLYKIVCSRRSGSCPKEKNKGIVDFDCFVENLDEVVL